MGISNLAAAIKQNHLKNLIAGNIGQSCEGISFKNCLKKEIKNLEALARQGNADAQFALAFRYNQKKGLINDHLAFHWSQKAAQQGFALAQILLGAMYRSGKGVPQNNKLAVYWLEKQQEHPLAQFVLAFLYLGGGEGVLKNKEKAFDLIQKSANQNFKLAKRLLPF